MSAVEIQSNFMPDSIAHCSKYFESEWREHVGAAVTTAIDNASVFQFQPIKRPELSENGVCASCSERQDKRHECDGGR